jgi:hypothetical protein
MNENIAEIITIAWCNKIYFDVIHKAKRLFEKDKRQMTFDFWDN